ncbi:MAG: neutral/alkaline non-lysosomal ceramidase N-terminal domain-containing protein [Gemmataceae bacterium]|nr:neutral/alkaline non-lysosomal ceramidase N-terminal domain-containing protein [Gemmataceae bacterium]MCI0742592.1 neutral/alkaline non-lysosomal ceramidase N-terminal domain-containing protein [Gemmataceae bacterium]
MTRTLLFYRLFFISVLAVVSAATTMAQERTADYQVGLAKIDITPRHPIRLNGFGFRRAESEGLTQRIWAKAMAIDDGQNGPALLIAVDILGIPGEIRAELGKRLEKKAGLKPSRLAITASHTHTAPMLKDANQTIFSVPIPKEHLDNIDRYTKEFIDKLEEVSLQALKGRQPAKLSWGVGSVGFAKNRRPQGGPVDHDLPLLVVKTPQGKVRAIYVSYACHCVTLSNNKISGDWAGFAQEAIEDAYPGALALVSIGCGADSNPGSGVKGDKAEFAALQGREIAVEVQRLLKGFLAPVQGKLTAAEKTIPLPLAPLSDRAGWEAKAQRKDAIGHHSRVQLEKLDRKEQLPERVDYHIMTWRFGDSLAMVFLPGEVVVDFSLRLKRELDRKRLWINAYANDDPCYIPSERVLKEGGYEGGGAMIYYDLPGPFQPGLENKIIDTVKQQLGKGFPPSFDANKTQGSLPLSPQQSATKLQTHDRFTVELVAAEPLVESPVAIDFGPDGKLWVAEMIDYPEGVERKFEPGGRIRFLMDSDGDGFFDRSTLFLDKLPFPTGVTVWRKGVLICAAPDILYAEDTDGDGKADVVRKLFSGFGTGNYQGRVNSLCYGLDGWVYGSCGLFGGKIYSHQTKKTFDLGDRDFRIKPDEGLIEPATGRTQQGRARDDWDNWFGCDNSTLARHYVLPDHYLRRNPHVAYPPTAVLVPDYPNSHRLFPAIKEQQLFKLSGPPHYVTAACGLGVYRDDLLGSDLTGNLFTCETVNHVVHRLQLTPKGSTFSGRRAPEEKDREFLASVDPWCRPVQALTGPDGCLWIADMYRFVIEHPRWIPPEDLARLDLRAGQGMGRIYRVRPKDKAPRPWQRLDKLDGAGLVKGLDSPNGWQRDMAMQLLMWNPDERIVPMLEQRVLPPFQPQTRLQVLCTLAALGKATPRVLKAALDDADPHVRRQAVRCAAALLDENADIALSLLRRCDDAHAQVRMQAACALGRWKDQRAGGALGAMALRHANDAHLVAAVLSSVHADNLGGMLATVLSEESSHTPPPSLVRPLLQLATTMNEGKALPGVLASIAQPRQGQYQPWQLAAVLGVVEALERRGQALDKLSAKERELIGPLLADARKRAGDDKAAEDVRLAAIPLLGRALEKREADLKLLASLLGPASTPKLQVAAVSSLARIADDAVPPMMFAGWSGHSPALKGQILDALLSRRTWQKQLLEALTKKQVPAAEIDLTRRQRLLDHPVAAIRAEAAKVFAGAVDADRERVVKEYAAALPKTGDHKRGQALFAKSCSACHHFRGEGFHVGPDLAALANRTPLFLLSEILDPNKNMDSRYVEYHAVLHSGRVLTGMLAGETSTAIVLRGQQRKDETILRTDLEELKSTGKSLMPLGLEKELAPKDMADVFAYLTHGAPSPKKFAGNEPAVVQAEKGQLTLRASQCEIHGGDIAFESDFKNIGMWHGVNDHVVWRIRLDKPAAFDVIMDHACHPNSAGNAFVVDYPEGSLNGVVASTGGWDQYRQLRIGALKLPAGDSKLVFRPAGAKLRGALIDLRTLYLIPPGAVLQLTQKAVKPSELAKQILDDLLPAAKRQALVAEHADISANLVQALTADLSPNTKEEYRRIPWIWRVSVAAGKRNDAKELRDVLAASLPQKGEPLLDWQAVVVGGGVINGISLVGAWPDQRLRDLLKKDDDLAARLRDSVRQAYAMADNEKTPPGTRYDALRMLALDAPDRALPALAKYLPKTAHPELQMGAVSALADIDEPRTAELLIKNLDQFTPGNRSMAIDGLLKTLTRRDALQRCLMDGTVRSEWLSETQLKRLK